MDVICLKERVSSFQKNNARLTLLESVGPEKNICKRKAGVWT